MNSITLEKLAQVLVESLFGFELNSKDLAIKYLNEFSNHFPGAHKNFNELEVALMAHKINSLAQIETLFCLVGMELEIKPEQLANILVKELKIQFQMKITEYMR